MQELDSLICTIFRQLSDDTWLVQPIGSTLKFKCLIQAQIDPNSFVEILKPEQLDRDTVVEVIEVYEKLDLKLIQRAMDQQRPQNGYQRYEANPDLSENNIFKGKLRVYELRAKLELQGVK